MTESLFGCLEISFTKEMSLLLQNLASGKFSGCEYEAAMLFDRIPQEWPPVQVLLLFLSETS